MGRTHWPPGIYPHTEQVIRKRFSGLYGFRQCIWQFHGNHSLKMISARIRSRTKVLSKLTKSHWKPRIDTMPPSSSLSVWVTAKLASWRLWFLSQNKVFSTKYFWSKKRDTETKMSSGWLTALIFTGDVEDKLQRLQWISKLSIWRPYRSCDRDQNGMLLPYNLDTGGMTSNARIRQTHR